MQIFLCWSGSASLAISEALHTFLGDTIQELKPFLSSENIRKGDRWRAEISQKLSDCNFGILCLTKDNLSAPWILFEAGALAKNITTGRVTALLAGIKPTDVIEPLSQFQHTGIDSKEIFKLLMSINILLPEQSRLSEDRLRRAFDRNWSDLNERLTEALKPKPTSEGTVVSTRDSSSMIAETLELVRELKRGRDVSPLAGTTLGIPMEHVYPQGFLEKFAVAPLSDESITSRLVSALSRGVANATNALPTGGLMAPVPAATPTKAVSPAASTKPQTTKAPAK